MKRSLSALLLATLLVIPCQAGLFSSHCPNCGCHQLKKVCRTVPDVEKVTETQYTVQSEEVCVLGKTRCEERLVADPDCPNGQRCEKILIPTCDRVVTRTKIRKVTTTVEKPGCKCVLDVVCCQCGCQCGTVSCGQ